MSSTPAAMADPVLAAIAAAAAAELTGPLDDVVVLDAADPRQAFEQRSLTVGGGFDQDDGAITGREAVLSTATERGAGRRIVETTAVSCVIYAGGGDPDLPGYRASAGAILTAFRRSLRRLATVGDVAATAQLADQSWAQIRTDDGDAVIVTVTVLVTTLP